MDSNVNVIVVGAESKASESKTDLESLVCPLTQSLKKFLKKG